MAVSVTLIKAEVVGYVRMAQPAGTTRSRQPTVAFFASNVPCGGALFRPSPTGPKSNEKLDLQPPPRHRGGLCLGYGFYMDCYPLTSPSLRRAQP